jgi:tetratricopeptide (TPR) repeat protein
MLLRRNRSDVRRDPGTVPVRVLRRGARATGEQLAGARPANRGPLREGDLPEAIESAQAALRIAASPKETGRSLDRLGFLYYTSGKLTEGETYLRRSLQTCEAAFGTDSLEYAEPANDLAMLLRDLKRMDEAKALRARAGRGRDSVFWAPALAARREASTPWPRCRPCPATMPARSRCSSAAMAIHESRPWPERETEEYGTLCINLAGTYQRIGKYTAAEAAFEKGLEAASRQAGRATSGLRGQSWSPSRR